MALNINAPNLLRLLLLLSSLFSLPSTVEGQSTKNTDPIDFTKVSGWTDYRECLRNCFVQYCAFQCQDVIGKAVGCSTNKCLCGTKSVFDLAIQSALTCANSQFGCDGNESDVAAVDNIMTDYCKMQGYDYDGSQVESSTSETPPEESPPPTTSSPPPTTTPEDSTTTPEESPPPITDQDDQNESKPTTTTPSTTKHDSSETPSDSETQDQSSETPDSSSGSKKGSDFGTPEIVGTVVGIVSLIFTALGVYVAWRVRTKRTERRSMQAAHVMQTPHVFYDRPPSPRPPPPPQVVLNNFVQVPTNYNPHGGFNYHR